MLQWCSYAAKLQVHDMLRSIVEEKGRVSRSLSQRTDQPGTFFVRSNQAIIVLKQYPSQCVTPASTTCDGVYVYATHAKTLQPSIRAVAMPNHIGLWSSSCHGQTQHAHSSQFLMIMVGMARTPAKISTVLLPLSAGSFVVFSPVGIAGLALRSLCDTRRVLVFTWLTVELPALWCWYSVFFVWFGIAGSTMCIHKIALCAGLLGVAGIVQCSS